MIIQNFGDIASTVSVCSFSRGIALDVGDRRIGIAVLKSNIVLPHSTIIRSSTEIDLKKIIQVIQDHLVTFIVIGLPLDMKGCDNKSTKNIKEFAARLARVAPSDMLIIFEDERFSTKLANQLLMQQNMKRKKRHEVDDQVSAAVIMESFLKKLNSSRALP